jgi:hypothetical protein
MPTIFDSEPNLPPNPGGEPPVQPDGNLGNQTPADKPFQVTEDQWTQQQAQLTKTLDSLQTLQRQQEFQNQQRAQQPTEPTTPQGRSTQEIAAEFNATTDEGRKAQLQVEHQQATIREASQSYVDPQIKELKEKIAQMEGQNSVEAERIRYESNPENKVPVAEIERNLDPSLGGKTLDYSEAALVVEMRKAGGLKAFRDSFIAEGRKLALSDMKSKQEQDIVKLPGGSQMPNASPETRNILTMSTKQFNQLEKQS